MFGGLALGSTTMANADCQTSASTTGEHVRMQNRKRLHIYDQQLDPVSFADFGSRLEDAENLFHRYRWLD